MKHLITRASISVVLGFVWITFSLSAFATLYDDGFAAGLAACSPSSGGSACDSCCLPDKYNDGYNDGAASCSCPTCPSTQTCPTCLPDRYQEGYNAGAASCPIMPDRYQEGYEAAIMEGGMRCQDNPAECGLHSPDELAIAKHDGVVEGRIRCQENPAECGLHSPDELAQAKHEGVEEGMMRCRDDPSRCFDQLTTVFDGYPIDETYCDNGTKNCFSVENGLYLSAVYDENDTDRPFVKDVQMDVLRGRNNLLFLLKMMEVY